MEKEGGSSMEWNAIVIVFLALIVRRRIISMLADERKVLAAMYDHR
jgi:hypothetical protein